MSSQSPNLFRFADHYESFVAGQRIFSEGEPGVVMYAVKLGEVDVIVHSKVIETVGSGGVVGEMALIDGSPRSATAVARTDCQLVPIDEAHFRRLVQQTPHFALQVMRVLASRLRRMNEQSPPGKASEDEKSL